MFAAVPPRLKALEIWKVLKSNSSKVFQSSRTGRTAGTTSAGEPFKGFSDQESVNKEQYSVCSDQLSVIGGNGHESIMSKLQRILFSALPLELLRLEDK